MGNEVCTVVRQVLEQYPQITVAYVFGSAAHDRLTMSSDVDVAVAAEMPLSFNLRLDLATRLSEALQREVDLIDLQAVSGVILQQSLCTGQRVLLKDAALHARLIQRLWFEQADMMPYTRRILAERRKRFLDG